MTGTVTLTIKNVPEPLAAALRKRAEQGRRSMQRELLLLLEQAVAGAPVAREPDAPAYVPRPAAPVAPGTVRRLSIDELWQRAQALNPAVHPHESADLIRRARDDHPRR